MSERVDLKSFITANLNTIRGRIAYAAKDCGRGVENIRLLGISKGFDVSHIRAAFAAGLQLFGESYVQEGEQKRALLSDDERGKYTFHFVGGLQRNKVSRVVGHYSLIHSVDRMALAETISKIAKQKGIVQQILLQVNVSKEATKGGFTPKELCEVVLPIESLPGLKVCGLMCIASPEPRKAENEFAQIAELSRQASSVIGRPLSELSMGMSGDFELAIAAGATIIRIGSLIFGERQSKELRG